MFLYVEETATTSSSAFRCDDICVCVRHVYYIHTYVYIFIFIIRLLSFTKKTNDRRRPRGRACIIAGQRTRAEPRGYVT